MATDAFYLNQPEPLQGCYLALRSFILQFDSELHESLKYGSPCFSYKNRPCCYLWKDKKTNEPYVLFVEGRHLKHPFLEQGDRKKMKSFPINPMEDLPTNTLTEILQEAVALYTSGIVKTKA